MLERTAAQRRFDALRAIFERAASTCQAPGLPEPVVNILVDQVTFEAWVAGGGEARCPTSTSTLGVVRPPTVCRSPPPTSSPSLCGVMCGGW